MKEKLKAKLKSYSFWVSLASAVMVFLNTLGLKVDIPYLSQVTTAFLSILVIAGILTKPGESAQTEEEQEEQSEYPTDQDQSEGEEDFDQEESEGEVTPEQEEADVTETSAQAEENPAQAETSAASLASPAQQDPQE